MFKSFWHSKLSQFSVFLILVLIIYAQTFHFDYALDDDLIKINIEGYNTPFSNLIEIFKQRYNRVEYRPITILTFGIEQLILGENNPHISHFINVILFIFILFSVHQLLLTLFKGKYQVEIFYIVCLLAVHPLCTEVVANLKSRDGLLSMLFGVWSIFYLIKAEQNEHLLKYYIFSWFLFIIGLFAKLDILGIVPFIFGYYFIQLNKRSWTIGLVIAFVFFISNILIRETLVNYFLPIDDSINSTLAVTTFTENPLYNISGLLSHIGAFLQTLFIYIQKIIFPKDLLYYYGYNYYQLDSHFSAKTFILFLIFLSVLFLSIVTSKKNKLVLVSAIGFISCLFFATNFITPVAGIVADRYAFMSLFWFWSFIILLFTTYYSIEHLLAKVILSVLLLIFTFLSYQRTKAWENLLTLIETDAPKLHQSYEGMRIAANVYIDEYHTSRDSSYLNKAIECAISANYLYPNNLLINTQLGQMYFQKNNIPKASFYLEKACQYDSSNTNVLQFLGDVSYAQKDYSKAETYYKKALKNAAYLQRQSLINNISTLYYEQGQKELCLEYNMNLIASDSTDFAPYENLGYFYIRKEDTTKAQAYFKIAIQKGMPKEGIPF